MLVVPWPCIDTKGTQGMHLPISGPVLGTCRWCRSRISFSCHIPIFDETNRLFFGIAFHGGRVRLVRSASAHVGLDTSCFQWCCWIAEETDVLDALSALYTDLLSMVRLDS